MTATPQKVSLNIPTYLTDLPDIKTLDLTRTEQKLYLQLSLEFQIIMDHAPSFQMGAYKWNKLLPSRLQMYGMTFEEWDRISGMGDNNQEMQDQLAQLLERLERIRESKS
ncbi:MAG: hypothetical protein JSV04_10305 [Candidatus Heimdallarchaeota archaeon]|nr:MAG: hypothetical protein JSV04_10305 [Candidatus Heimdallarchaeota archaeon]